MTYSEKFCIKPVFINDLPDSGSVNTIRVFLPYSLMSELIKFINSHYIYLFVIILKKDVSMHFNIKHRFFTMENCLLKDYHQI